MNPYHKKTLTISTFYFCILISVIFKFRWYDIKMRWLRLLDRSRKRKMGMIPNMESIPQPPSESPSRGESISPNTGMELKPNFASNPLTPRSNIGSIPPSPRPDSKKSRFSTPKRENLTPRNLSPSFSMNAGHRVASVTVSKKIYSFILFFIGFWTLLVLVKGIIFVCNNDFIAPTIVVRAARRLSLE